VEQAFPLWEKATRWIKENLHRLLHLK
jgi:hypothetical protein